jgi:hypothetical protein
MVEIMPEVALIRIGGCVLSGPHTRLNKRSLDGDSVYQYTCTRNPADRTPHLICGLGKDLCICEWWRSLIVLLGVMTTAALLHDLVVKHLRGGCMCLGHLV